MAYEIIYECHSTNNKNVRDGELNILRKFEDQLYFEFGSDEMNVKKRTYDDLDTLRKDFDALTKLKEKGSNVVENPIKKEEPKKEEQPIEIEVKEPEVKEPEDEVFFEPSKFVKEVEAEKILEKKKAPVVEEKKEKKNGKLL